MATIDRQNRLLVAEDWRKIYTAFQQAEFKSYDFETLRRTMVGYLRENYPDDFNDYVESSEYVALIDLIAYVAQALSFRVDLNARENFLETAERRDSILRLARLINYNVKRNKPATGLLKISSVSTTQTVLDSSGANLANATIAWNDGTNSNYREQIINILNAANVEGQKFGRPLASDKIGGIDTSVYTLNSSTTSVPVYQFSKAVSGVTRGFEIVPSSITNSESIYESAPVAGGAMSYLYRNDGSGDTSPNTGFFLMFKQGTIGSYDFNVERPTTNFSKSVNVANINNDDVWLYKLDDFGQLANLWTKVPSLGGNNTIYNSLSSNVRDIYNVITRNGDAVDLVFGDGNFSNIPSGSFRMYYRVSDNAKFSIQPADMQNVQFSVSYIDINGARQVLTLNASLQQSVYNSAETESNTSIKTKAPQTYYSQNRMITAEDYNVVPLTVSQEIIKVRSVNRSASGISRAKEIIDPTGAYSDVSVFADDGILYREESQPAFTFTFANRNQITDTVSSMVEGRLTQSYSRQFYYLKYGTKDLAPLTASWASATTGTNTNTGYIKSAGPLTVGDYAVNNLKYASVGSLVKFTSPDTRQFLNGKLVTAGTTGAQASVWAKVSNVVLDGANQGLGNLENGQGPITLNDIIPNNAVVNAVFPPFKINFSTTLKADIIDRIEAYEEFALRYNVEDAKWVVITAADLNDTAVFSLANTGDITQANLDASWWFKFTTDGSVYTVTYRSLDYIFESKGDNKFYFNKADRTYDYISGTVVKDTVRILKSNTVPSTGLGLSYPIDWQIVDTVQEIDGYQDNRKVKVGFYDKDDDGVVDNPDIFDIFIEPESNIATKFVFFEKYVGYNTIERTRPYPSSNFVVTEKETNIILPGDYVNGQLFYFYASTENVVKKYNSSTLTLEATSGYIARTGRSDVEFLYKHTATENTRIDPAQTNIMDIYLLERSYDQQFRIWLSEGSTGIKPLPSTSDQLRISYASALAKIKAVSDQIVFHPVKYKILFGNQAEEQFQATFKVVKNSSTNVTDSVIKTRTIQAINEFFALNNFDFGDTFYFTELAAYIHNELAPDLLTVVIVPNQAGHVFGSLFQVSSSPDEIFVSGATVDDVSIIDAIGANQLLTTGIVVTNTTGLTTNVRSTSAVSSVTASNSGSRSNTGSSGTGY